MNKLGFGLMRLPHTDPNDAASVDIQKVSEQVDRFLEQGFTYFDTAWMYNNFASEKTAKAALVCRHPRESFTLATKLHSGFFDSLEGRDEIFNKQLDNTGAGYFDYYLLHGIESDSIEKYEKYDCFNWLLEKKAAGLVRHPGFSYHSSPELLDQILTRHPEMEFVQLQINYLDWEDPAIRAKECYEVCCKHNKPVIVMEPVKGGTLARMPKEVEAILKEAHPDWSVASWAIRFAAGLDNVMMVLSGMNTMEQVDDNTAVMKTMEKLSQTDLRVLQKALECFRKTNRIACTGCSYCTAGCPMNICIPRYFSLYNLDNQEAPEKGWHPQGTYYANLQKEFGSPSECLQCGQCEAICPQHLPIIENLQLVNEYFK